MTTTALITGGTSGIGRAAAKKLAQSGVHVLGPVYIRHCSQRTAATMLIMEAKQGSVFS